MLLSSLRVHGRRPIVVDLHVCKCSQRTNGPGHVDGTAYGPHTIEDPEYLNEPYSGSELWRYAPQIKLVPNKCDADVARRYLGGDEPRR